MLYAVFMRFDSLREITASLLAEARKLCHLGITVKPSRSTLADANKRRPEAVFEGIYRHLYGTYREVLSPDSRLWQDTKMDEKASRLHHHHSILESYFQGSRTTSQDR